MRTDVRFGRGVARAVGIRLAWRTAAVVLAAPAAAAAPADAADRVVQTSSVSSETTVPAGATRSLTLTCPKGSVALNGAPTTSGAYDSIPSTNPRRWTFRFAAQPGGKHTAAAVLRCVRLRIPDGVAGVGLVVGTRWSQRLDIPGKSTSRFELNCNSGQLPTGWAVRRGAAEEARRLTTAAVVPTRRGFVFRLENTGSASASALLHIRCLQKTQRASSHQRHTFRTRVASFAASAADSATHSCRPSEFSVSTGFSIDPAADLLLATSYPSGQRAGNWSFRGRTESAPVTTKLLCLSRTTTFR
jgi:hypothetical protein